MNKKPNLVEEAVTSVLGGILAAPFVFCSFFAMVLFKPVTGVTRFIAIRFIPLVRNKIGKPAFFARSANSRELPTPDIFKGAPNLAPAKQMKF